MIIRKYTANATPSAATMYHTNSGTFLPSFRGPARRMHTPAKGFNCRRVTEIVSEPLCELVILQPANQARVAVGAKDSSHKRIFPVLMIDVRGFAWLERLLADRALAALVGVDPVIVFRGKTVNLQNPRPPESDLFTARVGTPLLLPAD